LRAPSKPSRGCLIAGALAFVASLLAINFVSDVLWQPRYPDADPF
jgi:hypothetical protein